MSKLVEPIPEFRLNNIPGKLLALGEAIMMVARVVNKLVKAHNDLVREIEATTQFNLESSQTMKNCLLIRNDLGQVVGLQGLLPNGTCGIVADTEVPFTDEELADAELFNEHLKDLNRRAPVIRQMEVGYKSHNPPPTDIDELASQLASYWMDNKMHDWRLGEDRLFRQAKATIIALITSYTDNNRWIKGTKCPNGCGETLFMAAGGYITCSWAGCPNPDYADALKSQIHQAGLRSNTNGQLSVWLELKRGEGLYTNSDRCREVHIDYIAERIKVLEDKTEQALVRS